VDEPPALQSAPAAPYWGAERRQRPLFGIRIAKFDVERSVQHLLTNRRSKEQGVGLFVTPNIQHIAEIRKDPEFGEALRRADVAVCDGFPVYRYARLRGHTLPGRVTGRDVIERIFADPSLLAGHRVFFVLDSKETQDALESWISVHAPDLPFQIVVPPFGFGQDTSFCQELSAKVAEHQTSLLFLGVGAPRSELFVHRHRSSLPACWALCVGQSFKIALGLTTRPPDIAVKLNLEWLWRIMLEPRRLSARYVTSAVGFGVAVLTDLWRGERKR
jgi:N-acetylglucosaminyldiphosphoundecaprenol N-acetyl-beta-D-mannosaminyltransferase